MSFYIVDDSALSYLPFRYVWGSKNDTFWFKQSSHWANGADVASSQYGSVSYAFEGTSISFTGEKSGGDDQSIFTVSIDGGESYNVACPPTQQYAIWYTTPTLDSGSHNITLGALVGMDVDYALVGVAQDTPIKGNDLVVDSSDSSITYRGSWSEANNVIGHVTSDIQNFPLGNSTMVTAAVGDSFELSFYGTSVTVYGVEQRTVAGRVAASFAVDGNPLDQYSHTTFDYSISNDVSNFELASVSGLSATDKHTLVMNLTVVSGDMSFHFDYITYQPSFSTLAELPGRSSTSTSSTTTAASTSTTESAGPAAAGQQTASKGVSPGVIAGVVIAAIAVLVAILVSLLWWRHHRARRSHSRSDIDVYPEDLQPQTPHFEPPLSPRTSQSPVSPPINYARISKTQSGFTTQESFTTVPPSTSGLNSPLMTQIESPTAKPRQGERLRLIGSREPEAALEHDMQQRIERLTLENQRLMAAVPPPAYDE